MSEHMTAIGHSHILFILGLKAYAQVLEKDMEAAENSLKEAKEFIAQEKRITPHHMSNYAISQFLYDIVMLETSLNSRAKDRTKQYKKSVTQSGKEAARNARNYAPNKTEVYRLKGVHYWLINKQHKAVIWWRKSIKIGEALGAKVELARTMAEIGRRLSEKKSRYRQLDGLSSDTYLNRAKATFEQLNLTWDLEELKRILNDLKV
jgi:hypothetical protein